MSAKTHPPFLVEWSPRGILAVDPAGGSPKAVASFAEVATLAREVWVAVGRRSVFIRTIRVPNASPEEIRSVLAVRMPELFPLAPGEVAYDFHLTDDISPEGRLALVAAMSSTELRKLHTEAKEAGVRVLGVIPSALSSVSVEDRPLGACAFVQDSVDGLAIDVVQNGVLLQSRIAAIPQQLPTEVCRTLGMSGLEGGEVVGLNGLAMPGIDRTLKENGLHALARNLDHVRMNLEAPDVVAARLRAQAARKQRLALMLLVASVGLGIFVFLEYTEALNQVRQREGRMRTALKRLQTVQSAVEARLATAQAQKSELDRAFRPPQSLADVLIVLSNRTPNGVWLTGVNLERGKTLSVRGTATSSDALGAYLRALSSEPRLRDVRLVFANNSSIDVTPVVQFSISGFPVGNLPLVEPKARRSNVRR